MTLRRVVITGASAVATAGLGREAFFDGLLARRARRTTAERPRTRSCLPISRTKEARRLDRHAQFALIAAAEALAEAGDLPYDPERIGTLVGTGVGGMRTFEEQVHHPTREGLTTGQPVPDPHDDGQCFVGPDLDEVRLRRSM